MLVTTNDCSVPTSESDTAIAEKLPRVLLVEDDPIVQVVHARFLKMLNCEAIIAADSREAFEKLKEPFDLILLDIGLPGEMNGIEICRTIRSQETDKHIPIIVLTGFGPIAADDCWASGCDDFLVKPVFPGLLFDSLYKWLPSYQTILDKVDEKFIARKF